MEICVSQKKITDLPCNVGQQLNLNRMEFGTAKNGTEIER
jgi:hypothetical protein